MLSSISVSCTTKAEGVPEDHVEAARWYRMAAEQGDVQAQFNLAEMYSTGEGVPEDDAEAARWYRMAAEQGEIHAQFNLGSSHSVAEILRWYRMAAEQCDAQAQFNLGAMYDEGEGVAKDDVEAARWYRMSFVQQRRAVAAQFAFPSAKADSCGAYSGAK